MKPYSPEITRASPLNAVASSCKSGRENTDQFSDGTWLLRGFGEYSDVVLLIRCFEEVVDVAK